MNVGDELCGLTRIVTGTFVIIGIIFKSCFALRLCSKGTKKLQLITGNIVGEPTFQRILHMELSQDDPNKISDAMLHMFGL